MKRLMALPLAAALPAAWIVAPALAASSYKTKLTIAHSTQSGGGFVGKAKSPKAPCIRGRQITVYRVNPSGDQAIGSGWTQNSGKWWLTITSLPAGDYYAKTPAVSRNRVACKAARSVTTHAS